MGEWISLTASDGHAFKAYAASPEGESKGGLLVLQEIFGVNQHIRAVADQYATAGYSVIAPALFDRQQPDVELGYEAEDVAKGRDLKAGSDDAAVLLDVSATLAALPAGPKGLVGYCWGGYIAWIAALRLEGLAASVGYYGGGIATQLEAAPKCPVMLHFGRQDQAIPMDDVEVVIAAHPTVPVHLYDAGHGFNCDLRGSYDAPSATLAKERSLNFLESAFTG